MDAFKTIAFFSIISFLCGCTVERAEEKVLDYHVNDIKKTSIWVYPDGEILKQVEWYTNGIKKLEIPFKDNVPHGKFKQWSDLGDLIGTGYYKKGKKDGDWTSFYFDRKVQAERHYKDDHPVGDWEGWHYNRNKAFEEHYSKQGDSIDVWKKWYPNGVLAEENSCHPGSPSGHVTYYSSDSIRSSEYDCAYGKHHGKSQEYYPSGKLMIEGYYDQGIQEGTWTLFRADGTIQKQERWKGGKRDSLWRWFNKDGSILRESLFENGNGTSYGTCHRETDDFVCAESTFVAGELSGKVWYMKRDKRLRYEEMWLAGTIQESRIFYPDSVGGGLASEGFWKDGKREGIWRNWYANGVLMDSLTYVNGERVGEQFSYDSTGHMYMHRTEAGKNRPVIMHRLWDE